jgi:hypothetical protein
VETISSRSLSFVKGYLYLILIKEVRILGSEENIIKTLLQSESLYTLYQRFMLIQKEQFFLQMMLCLFMCNG